MSSSRQNKLRSKSEMKIKTRKTQTNKKQSPKIKLNNSSLKMKNTTTGRIRYAVAGLGYISQVAILPAFKNAKNNSDLVALISSDEKKLNELGKKYDVPFIAGYADLEDCLIEAKADAIYIAVPNALHHNLATRAASVGCHVLCEKPLAPQISECEDIIRQCKIRNLKLMTAYRLHFDSANIEAMKIVQSGKLGELKLFNSSFTMQVTDKENIRLKRSLGGGPLYDLGIYSINAARYIFGSEPIQVSGFLESSRDKRFSEVEEMASMILRFPENKLATLSTSFGSSDSSYFEVIGTKGKLRVEPAFEFSGQLKHHLTVGKTTTTKVFAQHDQFGAEIIYFSDAILNNRIIEPDGVEGLIDIEIIQAIKYSARTGQSISLEFGRKPQRPSQNKKMALPKIRKPDLIHAAQPHL